MAYQMPPGKLQDRIVCPLSRIHPFRRAIEQEMWGSGQGSGGDCSVKWPCWTDQVRIANVWEEEVDLRIAPSSNVGAHRGEHSLVVDLPALLQLHQLAQEILTV